MAPPKGNKFGVGHGRPPAHFTDDDAHILGKELLEWMIDEDNNKESDIVHLSEWYSEVKGIDPRHFEALCRRECFLGYYEKARKWMGKRLMKNKNLHSSYGNRFLAVYFKELKEHEIEMATIKANTEAQQKDEAADRATKTMIALAEQVQSSDRKIADKSIKAETKS